MSVKLGGAKSKIVIVGKGSAKMDLTQAGYESELETPASVYKKKSIKQKHIIANYLDTEIMTKQLENIKVILERIEELDVSNEDDLFTNVITAADIDEILEADLTDEGNLKLIYEKFNFKYPDDIKVAKPKNSKKTIDTEDMAAVIAVEDELRDYITYLEKVHAELINSLNKYIKNIKE